MVTTPGIETVAREGIALVDDRRLQAALEGAYRSDNGIRAVETAERVLKKLTSARWPSEVLHRFLSGWGATHGTVVFVSGLMIRAQREARALSEPGRSLLYGASAEIGEIIPEDVDLHGPPHSELFVNFANAVAGDDTWHSADSSKKEGSPDRSRMAYSRPQHPRIGIRVNTRISIRSPASG
jgi:hypothetical protein